MNFFLAWLGALLLNLGGFRLDVAPGLAGEFLLDFIVVNLVLGLFNLLPIPPLDGGRIAVGLLPLRLARVWARLERLGIVVVLLAMFLLPRLLADFGVAFDPFGVLLYRVVPWALRLVMLLAGFDVGSGDVRLL